MRGWLPYALVVLAAVAGLAALAIRPPPARPQRAVDYVVVAGAAGLRWDDVDPQRTPTLWRLAAARLGRLRCRCARRTRTTCPADGWLTLGAGNYAAWRTGTVRGACPPARAPELTEPDGIGANLAEQRDRRAHNQDQLPYGAVPGALAESVRCTVAVGPGAAIAAARPFGRVDRYAGRAARRPDRTCSSRCVLSIVDLGTVDRRPAPPGRPRSRRADAALARVLAARPDRSLVLVAGLSDTDRDRPAARGDRRRARAGTAAGSPRPAPAATATCSWSTWPRPRWPRWAGRRRSKLFAGRAADRGAGPAGRPGRRGARRADADRRAGAQRRRRRRWFFAVLAVVQLLLFVAGRAAAARGPGGTPGRRGPALPPRRGWSRRSRWPLIAAALAIPAALVADAVPWWRAGRPGLVFGAGHRCVLVAVGTAVVRLAPRYRRTLGPLGAVAGVGAAVVGVGPAHRRAAAAQRRGRLLGAGRAPGTPGSAASGWACSSPGCCSPPAAWRSGCRRPWRPVVVVLVGGLAVVMVGSPYLGADAVGAVALTAGVCVAAAISAGGWLTFRRLAWAALAGLAVTIGFALLDLRRPAGTGQPGPVPQRSWPTAPPGWPCSGPAAPTDCRCVDSPLTVLARGRRADAGVLPVLARGAG